jgi:hypothetical protein
MSNDQPSALQRLQSPEDREREILECVSEESSSGTVVRKELINWFSERVHHRDGTGHDSEIPSDFAEEFLHRHPGLAGRLIEPSPPEPHGPNNKRERRAGHRLRVSCNEMAREQCSAIIRRRSGSPLLSPMATLFTIVTPAMLSGTVILLSSL